MTTYSVAAYGVAVTLLRSSKTVLVEGASDKKVLKRLFLERELQDSRKVSCVVDEASLVKDAKLASLGAKDKVKEVAVLIAAPSDKFATLVDREWEGVDLENPSTWRTPTYAGGNAVTAGHSLQNYWFRVEAFEGFLKTYFGDSLTGEFVNKFRARFHCSLVLAAAYSWAAHKRGFIGRLGGLVRAKHLLWNGTTYRFAKLFADDLQSRQVDASFIDDVERALEVTGVCSLSDLQWLPHGHLGEEVIRAYAADLAEGHGSSPLTCAQIERGKQIDKLNTDAGYLAELPAAEIAPLSQLVEWASAR